MPACVQRELEVIDVVDRGDVVDEDFDAEAGAVGHEQQPHAVVRAGRAEARPAALLAAVDGDAARAQVGEVALRAVLRVAPVDEGHDQHRDARHDQRDAPAECSPTPSAIAAATQQRHQRLRRAAARVAPAGGRRVGGADDVRREHHRGVVLRDDEARADRADREAEEQEALVACREAPRRAPESRPAASSAGIDLARAEAVAHRADDQAHQDRDGDGGDVDVGDLVDATGRTRLLMSGISGAQANHAKKQTKNAIHVRWKARIGGVRMLKRSIRVALFAIFFPEKEKASRETDRRSDRGTPLSKSSVWGAPVARAAVFRRIAVDPMAGHKARAMPCGCIG